MQARVKPLDATAVQQAVKDDEPAPPPPPLVTWADLTLVVSVAIALGVVTTAGLAIIATGDRKTVWAMCVGIVLAGLTAGLIYLSTGLIEALNAMLRRRRS